MVMTFENVCHGVSGRPSSSPRARPAFLARHSPPCERFACRRGAWAGLALKACPSHSRPTSRSTPDRGAVACTLKTAVARTLNPQCCVPALQSYASLLHTPACTHHACTHLCLVHSYGWMPPCSTPMPVHTCLCRHVHVQPYTYACAATHTGMCRHRGLSTVHYR